MSRFSIRSTTCLSGTEYTAQRAFSNTSVVPREVGQDAVCAMLKEIARFGDGSFLAVLKTFGNR